MSKQIHILNGDSLKAQFPKEIDGELIIVRECLVEGNVEGDNFDAFFKNRAEFISQNYGDSKENYQNKVRTEFQKIQNVESGAEINLWFEDDLFCQVNFWFVAYLLSQERANGTIYLVRPSKHNQYGFGGLSRSELILAYENRQEIRELDTIANLWICYRQKDWKNLMATADTIKERFSFITPAIKAQIDRIPKGNNPGRPTRVLLEIMDELQTENFGEIFQEFSKREDIYGFGDVQVQALLERAKKYR
ncbi:DUF1835 domain-containing protein [Luteirhabdus pelagi]|uniref:DUF1835 domain-containing protein n=1 Tax=Luteirhabdus pelagi TaxID=2792783 RepID=UPI00193AC8B9|nr:DUF1835 domain-containing protein [Luteirhabdus pelagi]